MTDNHWIVLFKDQPGMLEIRKKHFADHVTYLTAQTEIFVDGDLPPQNSAISKESLFS